MSLRGPVAQHLHNEAQNASLQMDRWDGSDGMGWGIKSVLQCSSYFVGIYNMYISAYIYSRKLSPTFIWVLKFDVKLRVGEHNFRNNPMYVSFNIWFQKLSFFFLFLIEFSHFFDNLKNVSCRVKSSLKVCF